MPELTLEFLLDLFRKASVVRESCLPPTHPVWGPPGSAGASRTYRGCLEIGGRFVGLDPRPGFGPLMPGEAPRVYPDPYGLGPTIVYTAVDALRSFTSGNALPGPLTDSEIPGLKASILQGIRDGRLGAIAAALELAASGRW